MSHSLSPKTQELIEDIRRFKEGIAIYKQSQALQYAKDNKPEDRTSYLKYEYAESQVDAVLTMMTKGLINIHHESNSRITQAVNDSKEKQ